MSQDDNKRGKCLNHDGEFEGDSPFCDKNPIFGTADVLFEADDFEEAIQSESAHLGYSAAYSRNYDKVFPPN